jgi:hypothetical protein
MVCDSSVRLCCVLLVILYIFENAQYKNKKKSQELFTPCCRISQYSSKARGCLGFRRGHEILLFCEISRSALSPPASCSVGIVGMKQTGRETDRSLHPVPRLRMDAAVCWLQCDFMGVCWSNLIFVLYAFNKKMTPVMGCTTMVFPK